MSENKIAKIAEPFVCGGTAATMASIAIHPMDLAKVSVVGNETFFCLLHLLRYSDVALVWSWICTTCVQGNVHFFYTESFISFILSMTFAS